MNGMQDIFELISAKAEAIAGILLLMSASVREDCTAAALNYLSESVHELEQLADNGVNCIIQAAKTTHSA